MTELRSTNTTRVDIDGRSYPLDRDVDLVALMARIEAAARSVPAFVVLFGAETSVSVLISPSTRVAITVDSGRDARRTGHDPIVPVIDWDL